MQFDEGLFLVSMLSFDLPSKFVLFVQGSVFVLDDIHLQDGTRCVLLCFDDLNLPAVVLDLRDYVNEDLLKALQLASESHLVLSLET